MIRVLQIGMIDALGGIETFLMSCYRNIDKTKIQFDFINMYDHKIYFQDEIEMMGGIVYKIPNEKTHPILYKKALKNIILENNYKIVHINKNSVAFDITLKIVKELKVPVRILHSHNTKSNGGFITDLIHKINKNKVDKYCNCFFACSDLAAKWMFNKKVYNEKKYEIINNAIDVYKFDFNDKKRKEKRKELGFENNEIVIGIVGRITKQKNHKFLIDVFNELVKKDKNYRLIIIGRGELEDKLKKQIENYGIENKVKFLGVKNDVNDYYQAMDIFALPSLYEGLGIVFVEAQISGLKCIASTEVPKNAKICENLLYIETSEKLWVDKILEITKYKRESQVKNALEKGYDMKTEAKKLEEKYYSYLENENEL